MEGRGKAEGTLETITCLGSDNGNPELTIEFKEGCNAFVASATEFTGICSESVASVAACLCS